MSDDFHCNGCGELAETLYFYCRKCHDRMKEETQRKWGNTSSDVQSHSDAQDESVHQLLPD